MPLPEIDQDIVLTYAPFGAPRAKVFAHLAADRWGWQLYLPPYVLEGATSPMPIRKGTKR